MVRAIIVFGKGSSSDHSQPGICRNKPPGCAVCLQSPSYAVCLLHTGRSQLSRRKCKLSVPQKLKGSRWVGGGSSLGSAASGYKLPSQICSSDVLDQMGCAGRGVMHSCCSGLCCSGNPTHSCPTPPAVCLSRRLSVWLGLCRPVMVQCSWQGSST